MSAGDWKDLFLACESGNVEMVRYYIKEGVDLNYQHPEYMTSLLIESVRQNHLEIIEILLRNGADPHQKEGFSTDTAISIAKSLKNKAALQMLTSIRAEKPQPHLEHQNVLITGGNRGIGKAIAEKILGLGHTVVITARKLEEGEKVAKELKEKTGNYKMTVITGELSGIESCFELAEKINADFGEINVLVNNAGVWKVEKEINKDGLELSFMVNYVAPYILSKVLFPALKKNQPSRIVNVNAGLFVKGDLNLSKTPTGLDFHQIKTYATTKLCNVLFNIDYAREIQGSGVTINAVHPGVINTGLGDSPKFISKLIKFIKPLWKSVEYGSEAPTWLALNNELSDVNGKYFNEKNEFTYPEKVTDQILQKKLREKTEEIIAAKIPLWTSRST